MSYCMVYLVIFGKNFFGNKKYELLVNRFHKFYKCIVRLDLPEVVSTLFMGVELANQTDGKNITRHKNLSSSTNTNKYLLFFFARILENTLHIHLTIISRRLIPITRNFHDCHIVPYINLAPTWFRIYCNPIWLSSLPMQDLPHQALIFT